MSKNYNFWDHPLFVMLRMETVKAKRLAAESGLELTSRHLPVEDRTKLSQATRTGQTIRTLYIDGVEIKFHEIYPADHFIDFDEHVETVEQYEARLDNPGFQHFHHWASGYWHRSNGWSTP